MRAITVRPPKPGVYIRSDVREPRLEDDKVIVKILWTGICGTDREIVNGEFQAAYPPPGKDEMILGHEAIGVVEKVGRSVGDISEGEYVMPVNRRGCGRCLNCLVGRADYCETGGFVEAGMRGMDGFMAEYILDDPLYLVKVPKSLVDVAVLAQPLSDLEKSLETILSVQSRSLWTCRDGTYGCRKAIVIGTGPIGLLISILLRSRGFRVVIVNRRDLYQREKEIIDLAGIRFYNSANGYEDLYREIGSFDLVFDTTSNARVIREVLKYMAHNSILALFGFAKTSLEEPFDSRDFTNIALKNIALVGLINGQKKHFQMALNDIALWRSAYPGLVEKLITSRVDVNDTESVVQALKAKQKGEIKVLIRFAAE